MAWREVDERILGEEHRGAAHDDDDLERCVERFEAGAADGAQPLHDERVSTERFEAHLSSEDGAPLLALRRLRGAEEADALVREHAEQRELLDFLVRRLALPGRPATLLARELRQIGLLLRDDMAGEERMLASAADGGPGFELGTVRGEDVAR